VFSSVSLQDTDACPLVIVPGDAWLLCPNRNETKNKEQCSWISVEVERGCQRSGVFVDLYCTVTRQGRRGQNRSRGRRVCPSLFFSVKTAALLRPRIRKRFIYTVIKKSVQRNAGIETISIIVFRVGTDIYRISRFCKVLNVNPDNMMTRFFNWTNMYFPLHSTVWPVQHSTELSFLLDRK
jgi:hypothetical protein